jgi:hypothetical protein
MTTKEAAWRHPVHGRLVILPDGHTMTGSKALNQGWKIEDFPANVARTATPHPHEKDLVLIARGATAERAKAIEAGFTVDESAVSPSATGSISAKSAAHASWRGAVLALPDARERGFAAAEIVNTHTEHTMSVANARAFLRGLPTETTEETTTMTTDTNANPERAARLAEINGGMRAFNKQRGYGARVNTTASQSRGASPADVDQTKLRRLSQIRLNALESGTAHEASAGETKKLRYALSVTGMALSDVFAQLNVDTSRLSI